MRSLVFRRRTTRPHRFHAVTLRSLIVLGLLLQCTGLAQATMLCFCVDCPAGSSIGLPVGIGHGFVQFKPMNNAEAGQTLSYGFYPATNNIFGGAGIVKNDGTRRSDFCICYPVTPAQYNAAVAALSTYINTPPAYNMGSNNCVDMCNAIATAAGLTLPNTATSIPFDGSVSDPAAMWNSLDGIGNGGAFMGGTVMATGGAVAMGTPLDYSTAGLVNDGHSNPANVAAYTGLAFDPINLGAFSANLGTGITLDLTNGDPSHSIISMDWGDGTADPGQFLSNTHVYSSPGSYNAQLFVMDSGAVHSYDMLVNVGGSPSDMIDVTISHFSPGMMENSGFQPGTVPLTEVPEPSTLALLAGGMAFGLVVMVRRRRTA